MVEWIPWLLIIIGWNANAPDEQQVIAIEVAVDQEECDTLGKEYMGSKELSNDREGHSFRYLCSPMPDHGAFAAAADRWQSQLDKQP